MGTWITLLDFKTAAMYFSIVGGIAAVLILYFMVRKRIDYIMYSPLRESIVEVPKLADTILELLRSHEDVDIRLLMELYESEGRSYYRFPKQPKKIYVLRELQADLRKILKEVIKSKEHYGLKDKILGFIDEAETKATALLEKKPFDDLGDPEKSLLIDILEELPKDKAMPKQKLLQMAEIIKNKYQNIEKLQLENQKSAAWTRWGAFGTLIFGILSLVLSLYPSK